MSEQPLNIKGVPDTWDIEKWKKLSQDTGIGFISSVRITDSAVKYFIKGMRAVIPPEQKYYPGGNCYDCYKKLKCVFPDAEAYYDSDHIITKIEGRYYDITGEVEKGERFLEVLEHYGEGHLEKAFGL